LQMPSDNLDHSFLFARVSPITFPFSETQGKHKTF
jgi:hypothetical protein